jgi:SsrA-binding protein
MPPRQKKIISQNRRARFDYALEEFFEAGLVLTGSEVKSLRKGGANIQDAYASNEKGELYLINSHIDEWQAAGHFNHEPRRPRKLLLKKREISTLIGAIERKGYTVVPISLYFNPSGIAKIELALGKGKSKVDKRATSKERDWKRDQSRILKAYR